MHICVLNPYFYPYHGGTEKVLLNVYKRLSKKHEITVITSSMLGVKAPSSDYVDGIKVIRLPTSYISAPGLPLPFAVMKGLNDAITKEHAEIYHINNRYQYNMSNIRAIKKIGKLVLTIHNSLPKNIDFFTDLGGLAYDVFWGRRMMHESDMITGVSKYAITSTVPEKDRYKSHVVYNGVDFNIYRPLNIRHREFVILNNGRLVKQKGQEVLLKAFALFAKKYDAKLVIIGKGPLEHKLVKMAEKFEVEKQFSIVSNIKEESMPRYYNSANVFVMPSLYEPAGMALIEAMACETPSIASDIGGIPEVMGNCGVYIKPNDVDMIYNKLVFALENYDYMKKLAKCARRRVIQNNNWDSIAKRYEHLFLGLEKR
ncbi:MAG: glycosyltransferase family 4 protein [Candidatus Micrarchaeia archaeon]